MKHKATWNKWDVLTVGDYEIKWRGMTLHKGSEVVAMSGLYGFCISVIPFEVWSVLNELLPNDIATDDFYYDVSEGVLHHGLEYKTTITT